MSTLYLWGDLGVEFLCLLFCALFSVLFKTHACCLAPSPFPNPDVPNWAWKGYTHSVLDG